MMPLVSQNLNHLKMAYTIEEASDLLSLSRAQIYRLIDRGEIETIKIGKARRVTVRQLEAFLQRLEQQSGTPSLIEVISARARSRRTTNV